MNSLIQSIADWLTNSHSISMPGWMWLINVPIGLVILGAIMYVFVFVGFARAFRPW
jgi:uncharacterized integral membrane protein